MKAKSKDGTFLFHSIEPGRSGQGYFLHEKERQEEAEQWLDTCFNCLLHTYGAETCKRILGGDGHVQREAQVRVSPQISAYLEGLNLTPAVNRVRDDHLRAPPAKKTRAQPRIRYGTVPINGAWSNLHTPETSQVTPTAPSPSLLTSPSQTPTPTPMTQSTPPYVPNPPTVDLTGHDQTKNTTGTQDTLDSTV
jgi:hypothetical protein